MQKDVYVEIKQGDNVLKVCGDIVVEPDNLDKMKDEAWEKGRIAINVTPV